MVTRAILITGTSSGIGRQAALHFDRQGHRVFAGVRRQVDVDSLREEASERLVPLLLEVTDERSIEAARARIASLLGEDLLYGLVNNAGVNIGGVLECVAMDRVRQLFEVNVFGALAVTQRFLPLLRKGKGRVVNISSPAACFATPFGGAYSASKIALEALTHGLRRELRPWGIFASVVRPGATESAIWQKTAVDPSAWGLSASEADLYGAKLASYEKIAQRMKGRLVSATGVVRAIERALFARRPKPTYVVGADAWAATWIAQVVPERVIDYAIDKML